jgi:hypothetical protein
MIEAILVYLVVSISYLILKPSLSFHEDGTMKSFGLGRDISDSTTLFPFWLIILILPIIIFFFFSLLSGWSMPSK